MSGALLLPALAAGSSGQGALYVDDVFSTYLYTGNGSTQNISGPNFADNAGLVWLKNRTSAGDHYLFDTVRGALNELNSNNTHVSASLAGSLTAFLNNGFSVGNSAAVNQSGQNYVGWQFRRAPKFFDVVTFTTGTGGVISFPHSLEQTPGMVVFKQTALNGSWYTWHRSLPNGNGLFLDSANGQSNLGFVSANFTDSTVSVPAEVIASSSGQAWVAYLFAHDPSAEGVIQCGSFTTDASGNATVNLGWANGSQFAMIKAASTTGDWETYDTARTSAWSGNDARLRANLSNAEDSVARISASGTSITFAELSANSTYIYMVVRSPS